MLALRISIFVAALLWVFSAIGITTTITIVCLWIVAYTVLGIYNRLGGKKNLRMVRTYDQRSRRKAG